MARAVRRDYRFWETLVVSVGACLSVFAVTPVISTVLRCGEPDGHRSVEANPSLPAIPGLSYALAEVECRTWHRNRARRPFNFFLKN